MAKMLTREVELAGLDIIRLDLSRLGVDPVAARITHIPALSYDPIILMVPLNKSFCVYW